MRAHSCLEKLLTRAWQTNTIWVFFNFYARISFNLIGVRYGVDLSPIVNFFVLAHCARYPKSHPMRKIYMIEAGTFWPICASAEGLQAGYQQVWGEKLENPQFSNTNSFWLTTLEILYSSIIESKTKIINKTNHN